MTAGNRGLSEGRRNAIYGPKVPTYEDGRAAGAKIELRRPLQMALGFGPDNLLWRRRLDPGR